MSWAREVSWEVRSQPSLQWTSTFPWRSFIQRAIIVDPWSDSACVSRGGGGEAKEEGRVKGGVRGGGRVKERGKENGEGEREMKGRGGEGDEKDRKS